ncbi:Cu(I)-responsive transcriptional regulator [Moraxella nasovis]|uniref:Cu(I)-responsive transcriptional regulator n=1 Tax=Moraxella nasovis TaxID=2904121 RepID=UPI001F6183CF|nr:Cu(I)-responsive transcriptional regulator [Moraxella nasovis]UNU73835.1 Cu(I)-responsive transcriptional regulator [Moraxella nasovis]
MKISEVAKITGLSSKQIRDYEKLGLLTPAERTFSGYRDYKQADLARLHFIHHAREVGFGLAQIGELLALQDNPNRKSCDVKALTASHIATLAQKIAQLEQMKNTLQAWHDECAGDERSHCAILQNLQ